MRAEFIDVGLNMGYLKVYSDDGTFIMNTPATRYDDIVPLAQRRSQARIKLVEAEIKHAQERLQRMREIDEAIAAVQLPNEVWPGVFADDTRA